MIVKCRFYIIFLFLSIIRSDAQIPTIVKTKNKELPDTILIYNPYNNVAIYKNESKNKIALTGTSIHTSDPFKYQIPDTIITEQEVLKLAGRDCELADQNIISKIVLPSVQFGPLYQYIKEHIYYPTDARKKNVHGIAVVEFRLDYKNSKVLAPRIYHSVYPSIDKEAIKLVANMPNWNWGLPNAEQGYLSKKKFLYRILIVF